MLCLDFGDFAFNNEFDGVWACASVLHTPKNQIEGVIKKLGDALKAQAVLYASFKYDGGDTIER